FINDNDFNLGVDIASKLVKDKTKAMILFIDGLQTNGSDVLDGITSVNNTVVVAGGMSGDNGVFKETFIFNQNGVYQKGSVALSLNSDSLDVFTNYQLNWQAIGQFMTVTKAEKNRLYEIDGIPASEVYRKYLGDKVGDGLPHSAIEFPLLKIEDDGLEICRTFVHKFDDGSLLTIGNLEVGDKVKLAFGNVELVMNNSKSDILGYKQFQPEAIFTYSCTARISFLQSQVLTELEPLNEIAPIAGFFTYGEIFHQNNKNSLLNITLTVLGLSENNQDMKIKASPLMEDLKVEEKNFIKDKHFLVLDALTHLSNTVIEELNDSDQRMKSLFDAAPDAITILKNGKWVDCNPATLELFGADTKEEFINRLPSDISPEFQPDGMASMQKVYEAVAKAIELGNYQMEWEHIRLDNAKPFTCDVTLAPMIIDEELHVYGIIRDITQRKLLEKELEDTHKHTQESIEYASLIQGALIPDNAIFEHFFQDSFAIWQPKDIVGGDIYLMNKINENEFVLMVIDCTGHGVPGAFVTMLVKAIERQLMSNIHNEEITSPAKILSIFNKSIKHLLKQESMDSVSNAGFDGGILYYNKKEKYITYAGAETPLFYVEDDRIQVIKGSRHSIGYKKSDINFEFTQHRIDVKNGMCFYLTTDGYLDQNGGEKGFPYAKKRFKALIEENHTKPMLNQEEIFLDKLNAYQGNEETNDDITIVGFKI
ncbi:SpoIIE family protein phosphatase, partial [Sulfurimonas sp.]|nr:SpoIIE family protein phosphatase [Sulfurimonas sp.]